MEEEERLAYREGMEADLEYARTFTPGPGVKVVQEPRAKKRKMSLTDRLKANSSSSDEEEVKEEKQPSYPEITMLGTGSSVPSKYRNVSSILVELEADSFILLDCGEGSLGQLVRLRGWEGAMQVRLLPPAGPLYWPRCCGVSRLSMSLTYTRTITWE